MAHMQIAGPQKLSQDAFFPTVFIFARLASIQQSATTALAQYTGWRLQDQRRSTWLQGEFWMVLELSGDACAGTLAWL